jgi:hypothetical protein
MIVNDVVYLRLGITYDVYTRKDDVIDDMVSDCYCI